MEDNTTLNAGSGGDTIASDDIAGIKYQRNKLALGADGSATDAVGGAGAVSAAVQRVTLASDDPLVAAAATETSLSALAGDVGDTADAAATAGSTGTLHAKLRLATSQLDAVKTSVELIDDAIKADDAAFTPATTKVLMAGFEFDDSSPDSVDEGDAGAARMSARREVYVQVRDAAGNERGLNVDAAGAIAVAAHAVTNAGTFAVQATESDGANVTLGAKADAKSTATDTTAITIMQVLKQISASVQVIDDFISGAKGLVTEDNSAAIKTAVELIDDAVLIDDNAFGIGTSKIHGAGFLADETATDSVDEGDLGVARITLDRKQIATLYPHTAGGLSTFAASSMDGSTALTNTAQAIKASAGQLYGYYIYNPNATAQFVLFYNTAAASVTVGTTSPLFMLTIPATSAANLMFPYGVTFSNAGWSMAAASSAGGPGAPSTAIDAVVWFI